MKLNGKKIEGANIEIIVIPRGNDAIILKAQALLSMDEFHQLCPSPKPPIKKLPGGTEVPDVEDEGYRQEVNQYAEKRFAYTHIKALEATPGLEWDTVDITKPSTWLNWEKELRDAGFNYIEIQRIQNGVMSANCLNEAKLDEARQRFLASQQAQPKA